MIIKVTQEHIDAGTRKSCFHCPIALAVKEATCMDPAVRPYGVRFYAYPKYIIELPNSAIRFIENFDNHVPVKPFEFNLDFDRRIREI